MQKHLLAILVLWVAVGTVSALGRGDAKADEPAAGAAATGRADGNAHPLILSAPVTHSDWMLRAGAKWGPAGVHKMLDFCKASGWTRIYWRALDGGRALYRSEHLDPQGPWDADSFWNPVHAEDLRLVESYGIDAATRDRIRPQLEALDYAEFDTLAEAVRYGHEIGLEVHAWITINEDDHGWGLRSRFSKQHANCRWVKRDGTAYRSQLSFAYPEVMAYKLSVVDEIVSSYDVDGVFIDWLRTGDVRDNPQTDALGTADHGYEQPLVDSFQAKHGVDPRELPNSDKRWIRHRAAPHTHFMRELKKLVDAKRPGTEIATLVAHPWCYRGIGDKIDGNLNGLLLELDVWAQEGLIDAVVGGGYYRDQGTPEQAYRAVQEETGGRIPVWLYVTMPDSVATLDANVAMARRLGAPQILFWEADLLDDGRANFAELQGAMRQVADEGAVPSQEAQNNASPNLDD